MREIPKKLTGGTVAGYVASGDRLFVKVTARCPVSTLSRRVDPITYAIRVRALLGATVLAGFLPIPAFSALCLLPLRSFAARPRFSAFRRGVHCNQFVKAVSVCCCDG